MVRLPKISDPRGNLSFIQSGRGGACPFDIAAVAWCYDIPGGSDGPEMCLPARRSLAVALSGSFTARRLGDGASGETLLNRSDLGIDILPGSGLQLVDFATNTVALVLSSAAGDGRPMPPAPEAVAGVHRDSDIANARIIGLPRKPVAGGGSVSGIENGDGLALFDVRRIFYLYDVPADADRGGHSHFAAQELIIAMSGSFDVVLDDGKNAPRRFTLNRPYNALYVPAGIWRTLDNFSGGSVSAVLTSHPFDEADYVRDYDRFLRLCNPR